MCIQSESKKNMHLSVYKIVEIYNYDNPVQKKWWFGIENILTISASD